MRSSPHDGFSRAIRRINRCKLGRDRAPAGLGLPAPEKAEALAVPSHKSIGLHDRQSASPVEPTAEQHQREPGRIVGASGLDFTLLIERELLAQEGFSAASDVLERKQKPRNWIRSPTNFNQPSRLLMMHGMILRCRG
jgi:hypothetical protein